MYVISEKSREPAKKFLPGENFHYFAPVRAAIKIFSSAANIYHPRGGVQARFERREWATGARSVSRELLECLKGFLSFVTTRGWKEFPEAVTHITSTVVHLKI